MSANLISGAHCFNRRPDILAHLVWSASQAAAITVTGPGVFTTGVMVVESSEFCSPLGMQDRLLFLPDDPLDVSPKGTLRVEMICDRDRYIFYTSVQEVTNGTLVLDLPRSVERTDRRQALRVKVLGDPAYKLDVHNKTYIQSAAIHDLSYVGVGIAHDPTNARLEVGDILVGTLHIPGRSMDLQLDVRNVRPLANQAPMQVYGCRTARIADADRRAVVELVLRLSRQGG